MKLGKKPRAAITRRARELAEDAADLKAARKALKERGRWIPLAELKKTLDLAPTQQYGVPDEENPEWTAEDFRTAKSFAEMFPGMSPPVSRAPKAEQKRAVVKRVAHEELRALLGTETGPVVDVPRRREAVKSPREKARPRK